MSSCESFCSCNPCPVSITSFGRGNLGVISDKQEVCDDFHQGATIIGVKHILLKSISIIIVHRYSECIHKIKDTLGETLINILHSLVKFLPFSVRLCSCLQFLITLLKSTPEGNTLRGCIGNKFKECWKRASLSRDSGSFHRSLFFCICNYKI